MANISVGELLIIFVVALLVFGAKRIPEIARALGQGLHEFRSATREIAAELQREAPPPRAPAAPRPPSPPADSTRHRGEPVA